MSCVKQKYIENLDQPGSHFEEEHPAFSLISKMQIKNVALKTEELN